MKIAIYAICKNEEKFINRWYNSVKEADEIYVLDTGSTDNSLEKLNNLNIHTKQEIISPWRFDVARNKALEMIPKNVDICICMDIDEILIPGWRNILEQKFRNCDRAKYTYNYTFDENNNPLISFYQSKIHTRNNYKWIYSIHEVLTYAGDKNERVITIDNLQIEHHPDNTKSRSTYLSLLEQAVKENPKDDRIMHYLGREYMYYNQNDKAIKTLKKHLTLKNSTWKEERSASMRFIGRCLTRQNKIDQAIKWYDKAIKETPNQKDPYMEKAFVLYNQKDYNQVIYLCNTALDIKTNQKNYIPEEFSNSNVIYDLLSMCYYYKNDKILALYYINKALEISNSKRLMNNKRIFENMKDEEL